MLCFVFLVCFFILFVFPLYFFRTLASDRIDLLSFSLIFIYFGYFQFSQTARAGFVKPPPVRFHIGLVSVRFDLNRFGFRFPVRFLALPAEVFVWLGSRFTPPLSAPIVKSRIGSALLPPD